MLRTIPAGVHLARRHTGESFRQGATTKINELKKKQKKKHENDDE